MNRGRGRHGFTLLELLLACALLVLVGGFGLHSLSGGRSGAETSGLAQEVAEELKAARQLAISRQTPVAVCFPSDGGRTGQSQGFYQMEGTAAPRVTRHVSYRESHPNAVLFWGTWGAAQADRRGNGNGADFSVEEWGLAASSRDYILIFTPSGTVTSNGLPLFGGEYRLLISAGLSEGGNSGLSPTLTLNAPVVVARPHTVSISQAGAVTITPGAVGAFGLSQRPSLPVQQPAGTMPPLPEENLPPVILRLRTEPAPTPQEDDGKPIAYVPDEGYITVVAEAIDPSGDQLTLRWEADGGSFSSTQPTHMEWKVDPETGEKRWIGSWTWTPPDTAEVSDVYRVTCFVSDGQTEVEQKLGAGLAIRVVAPDKLAVISADEWWENFFVAWMSPHGTHVNDVTMPMQAWEQLTPVWAPNGNKIAFYSGRFTSSESNVYRATLYMVNDNGTQLRGVFTCEGDITDYMFGPSFSPDGAYVAFSAYYDNSIGVSRVRAVRTYGDPQLQTVSDETGSAHNELIDHTDVSWHPTQPLILYTYTKETDPRETQIRVVKFIPGRRSSGPSEDWPIATSVGAPHIESAHWSRNGDRIVYTKGNRLYTVTMNKVTGRPVDPETGLDITDPERVNTFAKDVTPRVDGFESISPRFSPRGGRIAVLNGKNDDAWELWIVKIKPDGSYDDAVRVTSKAQVGDVFGYNWSPDGRKFVIASWDDDLQWTGEGKLYVVPAERGGTPKDITPENFDIYTTPDWWSPGDP